MRQDTDEGIRSYCARIRGQANVCKYLLNCPGCNQSISYTNEIIRDILTRGIADHEIQLDLLGDTNQNMSLEETIKFVETKEIGKRSANKLLQIHTVNSARSEYKQQKQANRAQRRNTSNLPDRDPAPTCHYCGKVGHGKSASPQVRSTACPAYGKTCSFCQKPNHFATVCGSKDKPQTNNGIESTESNGAIFHPLSAEDAALRFQLCAITQETHTTCSITIDHHLYNHLEDRWTRTHSKPQPFIQLTLTVCIEDYKQFGLKAPQSAKTIEAPAMADTGCQSSLAGMMVIRRLGLNEHDLPHSGDN